MIFFILVDTYEFKKKNDYEYITQEIPETPLSETVFNQLSNNNKNNEVTKSRDFKTFSIIKEENNEEENIEASNKNLKESKNGSKNNLRDSYNNSNYLL